MDFSLNRDKKNTAKMLPFNLLIKIANATFYNVDLDSEGLQSSQVKRTPQSPHKMFTAHVACRNAHLKLTIVTGTSDVIFVK